MAPQIVELVQWFFFLKKKGNCPIGLIVLETMYFLFLSISSFIVKFVPVYVKALDHS